MIVYNYDADLEVSDTCVRSSLLSWVDDRNHTDPAMTCHLVKDTLFILYMLYQNIYSLLTANMISRCL